MRAQHLFLASAAWLLLTSGAAAQHCSPDDTPLICWRRFNGVKAPTADKVSKSNTGSSTATTLSTATALRDFLSFFTASLDTGKVTDNGTSVTLDSNIPFPFTGQDDRIKVQGVFSDPLLAADVQTPLGGHATAAKDKLTNFDDVTALISYSPVNRQFGRSIAPHIVFLNRMEAASAPPPAELLQQIGGELATVNVLVDQNTKFSVIPDPAQQRRIIGLVEAAATAAKESAAQSASVVKALTQLLNNQPQVYVSGIYHYRDALVGPDEWSVKATFELGPKSLNRFFKGNNDTCGVLRVARAPDAAAGSVTPAEAAAETARAKRCAASLVSFAAVNDPASQPDSSDRLSFSFEYKQGRGESVDLSPFIIAAPVVRLGTHSLVYSLTYGRPFVGVALKEARVDLAVNYEDISNDPTKKDRFVASLTFSQRISDTMTLPLSLTYANHAEYVPQSDRRVGVHFGISYKIPDGSGK